MMGALKCKCVNDIKSLGKLTGYNKVYSKKYPITFANGTSSEEQICKPYVKDYFKEKFMNNGIKYIIIVLNTVIRMACIFIIQKVGCSTESTEMIYTTNVVFVCTFFNTGILPMLCTANLEHQIPEWIVIMLGLKGGSSDFNQNWFTNIGDTIVGSMKFNIYFPTCMEVFWFSTRYLKRFLDKRGSETSNSKSLQQYINVWSGPQFYIHYKYSSIMNITFITFMFGAGLPILFVYASLSLLVLYCLENYMLYYVYKIPPAYDEKLNNHVLQKLAWAPFFLLAFGYWMLSSPQLLGTYESLQPMARLSDPFQNEHYWYNSLVFWTVIMQGPAGVLLYLCGAYFMYLQFRNILVQLLGLITNKGNCCFCKCKTIRKLFKGPA